MFSVFYNYRQYHINKNNKKNPENLLWLWLCCISQTWYSGENVKFIISKKKNAVSSWCECHPWVLWGIVFNSPYSIVQVKWSPIGLPDFHHAETWLFFLLNTKNLRPNLKNFLEKFHIIYNTVCWLSSFSCSFHSWQQRQERGGGMY